MKKLLLLGDEAAAQGAIDAGIGGIFGYPGTPSTEIFEYAEKYAKKTKAFSAEWSGNEKIAYEEALGMSYVGRRTMVTMKCVGLNVAADPFISSNMIKINGGFIAAVADDPGMHSSQNEQDARVLADFAKIICYEPSTQQECYDMTREAFKISEKYNVPTLLRLVTRIAHSRAPVKTSAADKPASEIKLPDNPRYNWMVLPSNARKLFPALLKKMEKLTLYSNNCKWNFVQCSKDEKYSNKGVIACGTGYNYIREVMHLLDFDIDILKIGFNPLPDKLIKEFLADHEEILLLEDGFPYVEEKLLGIAGKGPEIKGRLTDTVNKTGELNPDVVMEAVMKFLPDLKRPVWEKHNIEIPNRPPMLCNGCPHSDTYRALNEALETRKPSSVFSDIGCYTLGALKPFEAIDTCIEMGASVGMAKGAAQGGLKYSVAVIGDSTYEHSGLTTTLGAVNLNTPMTIIILDNAITAMTGMQKSLVNDKKLLDLIKGLGVDLQHIKIIKPLPKNHGENAEIIGRELDYAGLSVIIAQRECIQIL